MFQIIFYSVTGPSYAIDTACSSGMYALEQGYKAIRTGQCNSAVVAACNLCLHPYVSLQFSRLGVLSMDGKCKVFDEAGKCFYNPIGQNLDIRLI